MTAKSNHKNQQQEQEPKFHYLTGALLTILGGLIGRHLSDAENFSIIARLFSEATIEQPALAEWQFIIIGIIIGSTIYLIGDGSQYLFKKSNDKVKRFIFFLLWALLTIGGGTLYGYVFSSNFEWHNWALEWPLSMLSEEAKTAFNHPTESWATATIGTILGIILYIAGCLAFWDIEILNGKNKYIKVKEHGFLYFILAIPTIPFIALIAPIFIFFPIIEFGFIPTIATLITGLIYPPLGYIGAVLVVLYVALRYYMMVQDGKPKPVSSQDVLDQKRAAMEEEARRLHGDAAFLDDHEVFRKGYFKAFGNPAAPLLGTRNIALPPDAQIELTEGKGKKAKTITIDNMDGFIHYSGTAHLLTFAATGAGKGRGTLIPNLLEHEGSVLVIDPKGENAAVTARHRKTLQPTFILDPWGISGHESHSFNPLSRITEDNLDYIADAASIAEALVVSENGKDPHWNGAARALISGFILYIAFEEEAEDRHLLTLREILTSTSEGMQTLLQTMSKSKKAEGLIRRAGTQFIGMPEKEFGSVLSTALRHTQFLDTAPAPMRKVLTNTDFDLRDLKSEKGLSLYLCLPPNRLSTHGRWLRLIVNMAISAMAEVQKKPEKPVLFMLDEASILGHMKSISKSMGLMRSYGMQLWTIWQDLPQLKAAYKDEWQSFIGNAGAIQVFGVNDEETAEYFSKKAGEHGIVKTGINAGDGQNFAQHGGATANQGGNLSIEKRRLVTPSELMLMESNIVLCFIQGELPIACGKSFYDQFDVFTGKYDENPYL